MVSIVSVPLGERERLRSGIMLRPIEARPFSKPDLLTPFSYVQSVVEQAPWVGHLLNKFESPIEWKLRHSIKVAHIAQGLAATFNPGSREVITRAALLHDIGFAEGISYEITNKTTRLTSEEAEIMQTHVERGYGWISPHDPEAARIMIAHEEFQAADRLTYPRVPYNVSDNGVIERRAPVNTELYKRQQMLALADQVETLMSGVIDRPHKMAWTADATRRYLKREMKDKTGQRVFPQELDPWIDLAIDLKIKADRVSRGLSAK